MSSDSAAAPPPPPQSLLDKFASTPFSSHGARWDSCYRDAFTPWDRGAPSLALHDLLHTRPDLLPPAQERDHHGNLLRDAAGRSVTKKTALVPGCGRGHDVLLLSAWGYDVWGLDYSAAARDLARENQEKATSEGLYAPVDGLEKGEVNWVTGDFFAEDWVKGAGLNGKFDLIFDYTFLCALPPEARPRWAKRMTDLLAHDGHLVCLEFPTGKDMSLTGPPWGVSPELYEMLLSTPGEDIAYNPDGTVVETASPKPVADALHRLSLTKPPRTHPAGTNEDGSVRDFISVWSR